MSEGRRELQAEYMHLALRTSCQSLQEKMPSSVQARVSHVHPRRLPARGRADEMPTTSQHDVDHDHDDHLDDARRQDGLGDVRLRSRANVP